MAESNRMVEKSKKAIKDALLAIMYEKGIDGITVGEVIQRANVSRGTFYAHFKNLEDVRQQLINDLYITADKYLEGYTPSDLAEDPYPVMLRVAEILYKSHDPAQRMFRFINVYYLGLNLKDWLTNFILQDENIVARFGGPETAPAYVRYIAGGITYTYNMWILDDFPTPPEVFAEAVSDLMMNGLNAVDLRG